MLIRSIFAIPSGRCARNASRHKSSCPVTGGQGASVPLDSTNNGAVKLCHVPKLPFLGSMVPQHSGVDKLDLSKAYDWWVTNNEKFGNFYSIGLPGMGKDMYGTTFVVTDPNEYMKVLRKEGQHPFGAIMAEWPFIKYYADNGDRPGCSAGRALFAQGDKWQRVRRFMQTDLLSPAAAKGYVPAMIKACELASKGAPLHSKNMNNYTPQCSFDMFSAVAFGDFTGLAGGGDKDEQDERFCKANASAGEVLIPMMTDPVERVQNSLGIKSKAYSTFHENFDIAREIAAQKFKRFKERKVNGDLESDFERNSYASLALDRYFSALGEEGALEEDEVGEIINVALIAAVDTTSAMLNWCIVHLAMNEDVQEKLFKEISCNVTGDGRLTEDYFSKSNSPYLNAVLRENHRISPPFALNLIKENVTDEIKIHGETIPKHSTVICDTRSIGMDAQIVSRPNEFDPTRWLDEENVNGRKGTPAEVLDHPLYREPFSAGARKCPGSRVANFEVKIMLSQLVLDWKISLANDGKKMKSWMDVPYFNGITVQPNIPELAFEKRQ